MENLYKQYQDGSISRKEVYKKAGEIISVLPEKLEFVYEEYFKISEEEYLESPVETSESGSYLLEEETNFEEFIFFIANNDKEKIREIIELSKTE